MPRTLYCAEVEIRYSPDENDEEFVTYHVSALNKAMRDKAIDRVMEGGGEINFERYYTETATE